MPFEESMRNLKSTSFSKTCLVEFQVYLKNVCAVFSTARCKNGCFTDQCAAATGFFPAAWFARVQRKLVEGMHHVRNHEVSLLEQRGSTARGESHIH